MSHPMDGCPMDGCPMDGCPTHIWTDVPPDGRMSHLHDSCAPACRESSLGTRPRRCATRRSARTSSSRCPGPATMSTRSHHAGQTNMIHSIFKKKSNTIFFLIIGLCSYMDRRRVVYGILIMCGHVSLSLYIYIYTYVYTHTHTDVSLSLYIYIYIRMSVEDSLYVCMDISGR
jgi:hypothetical protein